MLEDSSTEPSTKVKRKMGRPSVPFPVAVAQKPENPGDLLLLQEVCERLGVHAQKVYVLVAEGKLHPLRVPGKARIYYAEWEVEVLVNVTYDRRAA